MFDDVVMDCYYQKRFMEMVKLWLKSKASLLPRLNTIVSLSYEDGKKSGNNICSCDAKEDHFIRHIYTLTVNEDGSVKQLRCGERCLLEHGFPIAFVRFLERVRHMLQKDIITLAPPEDLVSLRGHIDGIIAQRSYVGLLFLQEYGGIIKDFVALGKGLPLYLYEMIHRLHERALQGAVATKQQRIAESKQQHAGRLVFLEHMNSKTYMRCRFIREMLKKINDGEDLTPKEITGIDKLLGKYSDQALETTEKALPFLVALATGGISLYPSDLICPDGQNVTILQSFWNQVQRGALLSPEQLVVLRDKYKTAYYVQQFLNLSQEAQLLTSDLVSLYKGVDPSDTRRRAQIAGQMVLRGIEPSSFEF